MRFLSLEICDRHIAHCHRFVEPIPGFGGKRGVGLAQKAQIIRRFAQKRQDRCDLFGSVAPCGDQLSERYGRDVPVLRAGADKVDKGHRRIGGIPGEVRGSRTRGAVCVVCRRIPEVVRHRKERVQGSVPLIHGVGDKAGNSLRQLFVQSLARCHIEVIRQHIVDRVVPPKVYLAPVFLVDGCKIGCID